MRGPGHRRPPPPGAFDSHAPRPLLHCRAGGSWGDLIWPVGPLQLRGRGGPLSLSDPPPPSTEACRAGPTRSPAGRLKHVILHRNLANPVHHPFFFWPRGQTRPSPSPVFQTPPPPPNSHRLEGPPPAVQWTAGLFTTRPPPPGGRFAAHFMSHCQSSDCLPLRTHVGPSLFIIHHHGPPAEPPLPPVPTKQWRASWAWHRGGMWGPVIGHALERGAGGGGAASRGAVSREYPKCCPRWPCLSAAASGRASEAMMWPVLRVPVPPHALVGTCMGPGLPRRLRHSDAVP